MKIVNRMPKFDKVKDNKFIQDGWKRLREPKSIISAIVISLPLSVFLGCLTFWIISLLSPFSAEEFGVSKDGIKISINLLMILYYFIVVYIHELLHLIFIPNFLKSKRTFLGLTWFGGFTYTEEKISRETYIKVAVMPFIAISLVGPIILSHFGYLTTTIKIMCILNAAASSVDLLNIIIMGVQVPKGYKIVMNGQKTYYRDESIGM